MPRGSEARAGEIASRRLLRKRRKKTRTAVEEHVRCQRRSKQLGKILAKGILKVGVVRLGAVQETCSVPQQEKENFRFDTRRRFCGDRNEGESVGTQEAVGERVSNQSKHHRSRFDKRHQRSAASETYAGEEQGYCISTTLDTLTYSWRVWGSRLEAQCKLHLLTM